MRKVAGERYVSKFVCASLGLFGLPGQSASSSQGKSDRPVGEAPVPLVHLDESPAYPELLALPKMSWPLGGYSIWPQWLFPLPQVVCPVYILEFGSWETFI